ncbi:MAG: 50S ribosomal protein L32 [Parcubacteria group bacterium CG1_02_40_82]|uniref:Large ribosomal subunit protein bL32 n=3 Tax=Candidatus Portnoyibacteriota TaxID=1817913 RepID=A0A2M7IHQ2_9BACT|nr:MAG: 50S ribosomal protein L32 [Parcubacteria group bacterium CG1_02_40_82]PIQ74854.1 MAG: 50S ribosomal protein L32 [Candidatus Portnoybacteria bacterium CG11_big_fil_rev_8_21_14_0_20_40_15]PIS31256.1 MAG: 50S ribosomal protein L32 [Candidatus Portnoybacteria bacterium CG08_land_8_20_14_0_20_40_83]PIW75988.1 MAG: 50S ribosomal protein L32 [Candidatus Portnoybacteria bacterium CG_4_8_14_3_um_filter_40_10]PIY75426.1 MAG: 50S ribosomal protein L32 [Candidatus Portnoybacteria bacterium CG_4_10_
MPTMRQRHTKSRRNKRRSHHALKTQIFGLCAKCGQSVLPHRVCLNCGTYRGREIVDVLKKLTKKEKKEKKKEMTEQEKQTKGMDMESLSVKS